MKYFIIIASTAITLLSFSAVSYASCRDGTGPQGSLITCPIDPHHQAGSQAGGPDIRLPKLL
jgi:hypothetical protein